MDLSIKPGEIWVERIKTTLDSSKVLVAVIGTDWLTSSEDNVRRLDNPDDYVRLEIATALSRGISIIPVLINGANLPRKEDLPEDLQKLTYHTKHEIRDTRWNEDVRELIQEIEKIIRPRQTTRIIVICVGIGLILMGSAIGLWLNKKSRVNSPIDFVTSTPSPFATTTPLPPIKNSNIGNTSSNQSHSANTGSSKPNPDPTQTPRENSTPKPSSPPPWQAIESTARAQFSGHVEEVVKDSNSDCSAAGTCRVFVVLINSEGIPIREPVLVTSQLDKNGKWIITAKRLR